MMRYTIRNGTFMSYQSSAKQDFPSHFGHSQAPENNPFKYKKLWYHGTFVKEKKKIPLKIPLVDMEVARQVPDNRASYIHLLLFTAIVHLQHQRAEIVLQECCKLGPTNSHPCLLAAKLCYEQLGLIDRGLEYSREALEREKSHPQGLLARCYLSEGVGYSLKSSQIYFQKERQELVLKAFECFHKFVPFPNSFLSFFHQLFKKINDCTFSERNLWTRTIIW